MDQKEFFGVVTRLYNLLENAEMILVKNEDSYRIIKIEDTSGYQQITLAQTLDREGAIKCLLSFWTNCFWDERAETRNDIT